MRIQGRKLFKVTNEDIIDGKFIVPEGIESIGDWTFDGCTSLQQIILPEGLESIGGWTFRNCTSLQSIVLPDGLKEIGYFAFYGCISLNDIQGNRDLVNQVKLQALIGRKFPETYLNKIINLTTKA